MKSNRKAIEGHSLTPETDAATLRANDIDGGGEFDAVHVQVSKRLERERDAYAFLLQRTHYNLIGRHGWGDPDATLIGDAMGWDSGNLPENSELSPPPGADNHASQQK